MKFAKALQARAIEMLTEKSNFTSRTLQNAWARKDVHMSAAEALKHGLVDRVVAL
jgi:ATP-dependent protease ClpP protease subunit